MNLLISKIWRNELFAKIIFLCSLLYSSLSIISYSFLESRIPSFIGIPKFDLTYGDLRSPTHSSGCGVDISLMRSWTESCDPWNRPANFPKLLIDIYRLIGVDSSTTNLIGLLFGFAIIFGIVFFIFQNLENKIDKFWISSLCILSWPVQLVIERGNYDSIIFILCLLLSISVSNYLINNEIKYILIIPFLTFLPVSLKVFPLLGIFPWSLINIFILREKKLLFYSIILVSFIAIAFQLPDLLDTIVTVKDYSFATGIQSFGFLTFYQDSGNKTLSLIFLLLKSFLILFTLIYTFLGFQKRKRETNKQIIINYINFQIGLLFLLISLLVYFVFGNYDYRMIFIIGSLPLFISIWSYVPQHIFKIASKLIPYMIIFVGFQKYLPSIFDVITSYISDIVFQPYLIGFTLGTIIYLLTSKDIKFQKV